MEVTAGLLSIVVGVPLLYGGFVKVLNGARFYAALRQYRLIPPSTRPLVALLVPPTDAAMGVAVIAIEEPWSAGLAAILFGVYITGIAHAWRNGATGECGCFGQSSERIGGRPILRTFVLLVSAASLTAIRATSAPGSFGPAFAAASVAVVLFAALIAERLWLWRRWETEFLMATERTSNRHATAQPAPSDLPAAVQERRSA
jgi:hypothetical protein